MVREVSPIPPGRYWICVLGKQKQADFDAWIRDMRGAVRVEATSLNDQTPSTQFIVFRVPEGRAPFLDALYFGYPNTAPDWVTSIEQVEQHGPPVPDPLATGNWDDWLPKLDSMTKALVILALVLALRH